MLDSSKAQFVPTLSLSDSEPKQRLNPVANVFYLDDVRTPYIMKSPVSEIEDEEWIFPVNCD